MIKLLENINKYTLLLLVFSVTFENWDPFKLVGTISITYMTSGLYILTWLPLLRKNFSFTPLKEYVFPLLFFALAGIVSTALHSNYAETLEDLYNERVLQLIILMFLIAAHLANDPKLIILVLNTYVLSILTMYLLYNAGVGVDFEKGRLQLFGENPNLLGMKAVIALLIVLAQLINSKYSILRLVISVLVIVPLFSLIIFSASRGALASVFLGIGVMVFTMNISLGKKIILGVIGTIGSFLLFEMVMQANPLFKSRILRTIETGDTGRNALWEAAIEIFQNNPIIGVGTPGLLPEMFRYSGRFIDPHNTFLYVLVTTGIIGFFFYCLFIWRLTKNLYRKYLTSREVVYIVIYLVVLFNMSKAGGGIGKILFWFFFAILIASTFNKRLMNIEPKNVVS